MITSSDLGLLAERNVENVKEVLKTAIITEWNRDKIVEYAIINTWERTAVSLKDLFRSIITANYNGKIT